MSSRLHIYHICSYLRRRMLVHVLRYKTGYYLVTINQCPLRQLNELMPITQVRYTSNISYIKAVRQDTKSHWYYISNSPVLKVSYVSQYITT